MHGEVAGEWAELFLLKLNDEPTNGSTSDQDFSKIYRKIRLHNSWGTK